VTVPLMALAVPSIFIGYFAIEPMLFGDFFDGVITVAAAHDTLGEIGFHGAFGFMLHGLTGIPVYLAGAGVMVAWYIYMRRPSLALEFATRFDWAYWILDRKFGFDDLYQWLFAGGSRLLGKTLWQVGDRVVIDGMAVNGSAHSVGWLASVMRYLQTGYLYHYAFAMIIGLLGLLSWFVIR